MVANSNIMQHLVKNKKNILLGYYSMCSIFAYLMFSIYIKKQRQKESVCGDLYICYVKEASDIFKRKRMDC